MDEVTSSTNPLNKQQKAGFLLLLVFGIMAVGLGVLQMRNTIYGPFAYKAPASAARTTSDLLEDETIRLQSIDTDQDGINDYEELYFYQTSPYLPDSDSDGLGDKQEIDVSEDPLCPRGGVCDTSAQFSPESATNTPQTSIGTTPIGGSLLGQIDSSIERGEETDLSTVLGDTNAIREMIAQTGKISREELEKIDDQTLLNMVVQIMAEQEDPATGAASSSPQVNETDSFISPVE